MMGPKSKNGVDSGFPIELLRQLRDQETRSDWDGSSGCGAVHGAALRFSTITPAVVKCHEKRSLSLSRPQCLPFTAAASEKEKEGNIAPLLLLLLLRKKEKMDDTIRNGHFSIA